MPPRRRRPIEAAHHEQSETVRAPSGGWQNVYGEATPQAGQALPIQHQWEQPSYPTVEEAVSKAGNRSEIEGWQMERLAPVLQDMLGIDPVAAQSMRWEDIMQLLSDPRLRMGRGR